MSPRTRSGREEDKGLLTAADLAPQEVQWLWPGRIPLGCVTILDGDPGTGKSILSLDLAARITRGDTMPDGSRGLDAPRGVGLLVADDGLANTIRPRLDAAGADCNRVVALRWIQDRGPDGEPVRRRPTVRDAPHLEAMIRAVDAALVIVDPITAYMGGGAGVRAAFLELGRLAERLEVAILAVRHPRKPRGRGAPTHAGGGSIACAAACSVLLLAPDPDDPARDRRILSHVKADLSRMAPALALRIVETPEGRVRAEWIGESGRKVGLKP